MPGRLTGRWAFMRPTDSVWGLVIGVTLLLILPKLLILVRGAYDGANRNFGGTVLAAASVFAEIVFSSLLAPIMLMLQTRAVMQVLLGLDGGWPATRRSESWLDLRDAWAASWWIVLIGAFTLLTTLLFAPRIGMWVSPAVLPMIVAPLLIAASSRAKTSALPHLLFTTPTELAPTPIIIERNRILATWSVQPSTEPASTTVRKTVRAEA
jgi:membrane glycosyltransferase